ncbi:MAG: type IV secretory system conjugative DNA transfer family protein [Solirubrobacteraceae bacterium]
MSAERGLLIARHRSGERALPLHEGFAVLTLQRLLRHMLVCGATGAGKTGTLLRIAWCVAKASNAHIFYLDGKGDTETAERFCGLMADAGRQTRVFPNDPFDAWRGQAHEIHGRLMEVIDYASDGPAAWYRDVAKHALRLACEHPDGPPRDSASLLERLQLERLQAAHPGSSAVGVLTKAQVSQVRLRYEAFFGQAHGVLDGGWAWEDASAAYLLLDTLALKDEAAGLARVLFEDFAHYFARRKRREQLCVLIVDELSELTSAAGIARHVEQARGFNAALILAPQVTAGLGDAGEAERIVGSIETIVCHRVNTPEALIALAGTRKVPEHSTRYGQGVRDGEGTMRLREQPKIDANRVRALEPGEAYIISRGRAMAAQVLLAPELAAALPAAAAALPEARERRSGADAAKAGGAPAQGRSGAGGSAAGGSAAVVEGLRF